MISEAKNIHCMDYMRQFTDKFFDWAIVDPPYYSGPERRKYYGQQFSSQGVKRVSYQPTSNWQLPDQAYFDELCRVSKEQIIWGYNYFNISLPSSGRIIWDKVNDHSSYSDCEIAYCSQIDTVRIFRYMWNGMCQGTGDGTSSKMQGNKKLNEKRIHPTQKPVALYTWLMQKFCEPGFKILDTHLGSGSSRIAAYDIGLDFYACDIDEKYFGDQEERFNTHIKQQKLFNPKLETPQLIIL
jgi:site-specific DNA-methyltransferase (adenine-specific)